MILNIHNFFFLKHGIACQLFTILHDIYVSKISGVSNADSANITLNSRTTLLCGITFECSKITGIVDKKRKFNNIPKDNYIST